MSGSNTPNPRERVLARRRKVSTYLARQMSIAEISSLNGVSWRTTYRDLKEVRKGWSKHAKWAMDRDRLVEDLVAQSQDRSRALWAAHYSAGNDNVNGKIGALNGLREESRVLTSQLQSLGALPREPDKLEVDDWRTELRRVAARRMATNPLLQQHRIAQPPSPN